MIVFGTITKSFDLVFKAESSNFNFFKIALLNKPVLKYFTHRVCGHHESMKIQIPALTFAELKRSPICSTDGRAKKELVLLAKATIK